MINNMVFDGTRTTSVDIKLNENDPHYAELLNLIRPDFSAYRKNPSTAPGKER